MNKLQTLSIFLGSHVLKLIFSLPVCSKDLLQKGVSVLLLVSSKSTSKQLFTWLPLPIPDGLFKNFSYTLIFTNKLTEFKETHFKSRTFNCSFLITYLVVIMIKQILRSPSFPTSTCCCLWATCLTGSVWPCYIWNSTYKVLITAKRLWWYINIHIVFLSCFLLKTQHFEDWIPSLFSGGTSIIGTGGYLFLGNTRE